VNILIPFFENLSKVLDKKQFDEHHVYKADETGVHNAQAPEVIIAGKGKELVGSIKCNERRTLVSLCVTV
jgi:hypothetical protein